MIQRYGYPSMLATSALKAQSKNLEKFGASIVTNKRLNHHVGERIIRDNIKQLSLVMNDNRVCGPSAIPGFNHHWIIMFSDKTLDIKI